MNKVQAFQNPYAGTVYGEPSALKKHLIAFLDELSGTFIFLWITFVMSQFLRQDAAVEDDGPTPLQLIVISTGFGLVMAPACMFFKISPNLNPSFTFTSILVGVVPPLRIVFMVIAYVVAGMAAACAITFATAVTGGSSISGGVFIGSFTTCLAYLAVVFLIIAFGLGLAILLDKFLDFPQGWIRGLVLRNSEPHHNSL